MYVCVQEIWGAVADPEMLKLGGGAESVPASDQGFFSFPISYK